MRRGLRKRRGMNDSRFGIAFAWLSVLADDPQDRNLLAMSCEGGINRVPHHDDGVVKGGAGRVKDVVRELLPFLLRTLLVAHHVAGSISMAGRRDLLKLSRPGNDGRTSVAQAALLGHSVPLGGWTWCLHYALIRTA